MEGSIHITNVLPNSSCALIVHFRRKSVMLVPMMVQPLFVSIMTISL
jgi:hypothetical protein